MTLPSSFGSSVSATRDLWMTESVNNAHARHTTKSNSFALHYPFIAQHLMSQVQRYITICFQYIGWLGSSRIIYYQLAPILAARKLATFACMNIRRDTNSIVDRNCSICHHYANNHKCKQEAKLLLG